jgi:hypothetical protein
VLTGIVTGNKGIAAGQNGYTQAVIPFLTVDVMVGFFSGPRPAPANYQQLSRSFYIAFDNSVQIYENGAVTFLNGVAHAKTNVYRVSLEGGNTVYYVNGAEVHRSPNGVPAGNLFPVANLNTTGQRLTKWTVYSPSPLVAA